MVPHPLYSGYVKGSGDYDGQNADYRKALADGKGIHVKEYDNYYLVHWDVRDPDIDPLGHLWHDARHWLVIGIFALVALASFIHENDKNT